MNDQLEVLRLVARRLDEARIPYMLTGSLAMSHYAEPRFTRDVDVVIELSAPDVQRVAGLFDDDFYVDPEAMAAAVTREGMVNLIHTATIVKVDFIMRKSSGHHVEEFQRRRSVIMEDTSVWIVSPEDLVISKLLWLQQGGSDIHRRDIAALLASGTSIDRSYLHRTIQHLGLEALWREVSHG